MLMQILIHECDAFLCHVIYFLTLAQKVMVIFKSTFIKLLNLLNLLKYERQIDRGVGRGGQGGGRPPKFVHPM